MLKVNIKSSRFDVHKHVRNFATAGHDAVLTR